MFAHTSAGNIIYKTPAEITNRPMPQHKAGLSWTASGYGYKIPTTKMVRLFDSTRWYRVYCCIHSNSGTCYIIVNKQRCVVDI